MVALSLENEYAVTVAEALSDYLSGLDGSHKPTAIAHKRAHLGRFLRWVQEHDYSLTDLNLPRLRQYLAEREKEGRTEQTRYHDKAQIACFLKYCRSAGYVPQSFTPWVRWSVKKPKTKPVQLVPEAALKAVVGCVEARWNAPANRGAKLCYPALRTFMSRQDACLLLTLYETGCRDSDLCRLKLVDVDWPNSLVVFRDTKEGRDRLAPVSQKWQKSVRSYLNVRPKASKADTLFVNTKGNQWLTRDIVRKVRAYSQFATVQLTAQDFRRFRTSKIAHVSPVAASQICGHSLQVIQKHYLGTEYEWNRKAWLESMGEEKETKDKRLI